MRQPGARLVPGAAEDTTDEATNQRNGAAQHDNVLDQPVASANDGGSGGGGVHARPVRDPEAVRASIGRHFGGVHAARSRAQQTEGADTE